MRDEIFDYYERELAFLRDQLDEFARRHPTAAGALLVGEEEARDPHVERLIQAFSLIAGRIRSRLDDQYPELTQGLLNVLYPHYLAPIPSMVLVRLDLDPRKSPTAEGVPIAAGTTLRATNRRGHACRFRTCYPVRVWPVTIQEAELRMEPPPPRLKAPRSARCWLRIELQCQGTMTFPRLSDRFDRLRFSLCGQSLPWATALYELIFRHGVAAIYSPGRSASTAPAGPVRRLEPADALAPAGFDPAEALLPPCDRSFLGYALLTEFFTFPQKFLAFDLLGLDRVRNDLDDTLEVAIPLDILPEKIPRVLRGRLDRAFALGCVPAVNLYEKLAEPIAMDQRRPEYRVVPDFQQPYTREVYRVEQVRGIDARTGDATTYVPFYSLRHGDRRPALSRPKAGLTFWSAARRPSSFPGDEGTEVFLSLVDLAFNPTVPADATLSVGILCTDRDEPQSLAKEPGGGLFEIEGSAAPVLVTCLVAPTPCRRPALRGGTQWRLISHLALNSLSIADEKAGIEALQEILRIYLMYQPPKGSTPTTTLATRRRDGATGRDSDGVEAPSRELIDNRALVDRLRSVGSRRVTRYVPSEMAGTWCRGVAIDLVLDEDEHDDGKAYLFSAVLDRFFALYASINSFTELNVSTLVSTREERTYWTPKPRAGLRPIL
jgi:type VI secretion system protein ImpG